MGVDEQTYKNVARHCSAYAVKNCCSCKNSTGDADVSCTTCKHFTNDKHCSLDLFDPIVENHSF